MSNQAQDVIDREDRYQLKTYAKLPLVLERGRGCYVYDIDGTEYLDFYGGHAVISTGHCHPRVVQAIKEQAEQLLFYSNVVYNQRRSVAVEKLVQMAGFPYHQAFLANSGSEANENAIKLARALTDRKEVLSILGSFHGRTYGSLSSTGILKYVDYLNTPVPMHRALSAEEIPDAVGEDTAAVLVEPIQSMGGVYEIPAATLAKIRQACDDHGALLIFDEVQTGVGRTGRFLYSAEAGVYADLVTLAKGIASGLPASALLVTEELAAKVQSGDLGATFGGGPVACAALEATMDVLADEDLIANAAQIGSYLRQRIESLPWVEEVRGKGLLLGIKVGGAESNGARPVQQTLRAQHILSGSSNDPTVLRLMPPLSVSQAQADTFLDVLASHDPGH